MIETASPNTIRSVVESFVDEELSAENAHIARAVWEMLDAGGKRLRPRITMLAGRACDPDTRDDPVLASYMELIHVATLIHDDVLDNADVRRGRESTNHAHGNRFSVLAGDYLFAWVFKKVTQGYPHPIPTILAAMLADICNGEVKQLRAAGDAALPRAAYFEIIGKKTAALFAACAEVGAIDALARAGEGAGLDLRADDRVRALRAYGWSYGMAFQIRDDLLDATASEATLGKPAGSDLREKKVTLPLLDALEAGGNGIRERVAALFAARDASSEDAADDLAAVVNAIRRPAVIARTSKAIAAAAAEADAALDALPPSPARAELAHMAGALAEISS